MLTLRRRRRGGFTLIELLLVISIIAILAALSASAIAKFLGVQPVSNTRAELRLLQTAFHKKWVEVTEAAGSQREAAMREAYFQQMGATLNSASWRPEVQIMFWKKLRQKQAFPQTFYEVFNPPTGLLPLPGYVAYLKKYGITTGSAAAPQPYESGVCLLMALQRSVSGGGVITDDQFTPFVKQISVSGANVPCLVDGWKNPIQFCRWPLGNSMATPGDTTDPENVLGAYAGNPTMQNMVHVFSATKGALNLTPLIASMGPDGKSGLTLGTPGTANDWKDSAPDANDNIYSNNVP